MGLHNQFEYNLGLFVYRVLNYEAPRLNLNYKPCKIKTLSLTSSSLSLSSSSSSSSYELIYYPFELFITVGSR